MLTLNTAFLGDHDVSLFVALISYVDSFTLTGFNRLIDSFLQYDLPRVPIFLAIFCQIFQYLSSHRHVPQSFIKK